MNILFLISCINYKSRGNGGHYYDLISTVQELKNIHSICVVTIGTEVPIAIANSNIEFKHIHLTKINFVFALFTLRKLLKIYGTDIIHSFDDNAYFFARLAAIFKSIKNVLTLPGGKNPALFYPLCPNLILFSKENYAFFTKWTKYAASNIAYIPNRVMPIKQDLHRIEEVKNKHNIGQYGHIFLRITRITDYNLKSIIQSIELIKYLNSRNFNCCLIVIGVIEDQNLFQNLKSSSVNDIYFITEDRYTINANELIDIGDFIIGTGRGFMEAALQKKVLLAPCSNSALPVIADKDIIEELFITNFSQRFVAAEKIIENSLHKLCECLNDCKSKKELENYLVDYANNYFVLTKVTDKYSIYYSTLKNNHHFKLTDLLFHSVIFFKRLLLPG